MRFERDDVEFLGGVRHGLTLGSPVSLVIHNTEWPKWQEEMSARARRHREAAAASPGPVTPTSSACRSTASTTPATCSSGPAPARPRPASPPARWPRRCWRTSAPTVISHVIQLGPVRAARGPAARRRPTSTGSTSRRCAASIPTAEAAMIAEIEAAAKAGDSLGGVVEVLGYGVPPGLGSHVHWDRAIDGLHRAGAHEHPGDEGRRDRRRVRRRRPPGERGARRDPVERGRRALRARLEPRRRHRGRDDDRQPARGARRR